MIEVPEIPNLKVITGGDAHLPPAPEALARTIIALVDADPRRAEQVVVNAAPIASTTSVVAAASAVDEVIVVSRLGSVDADDLRHVASRLTLARTPVAGHVIINRPRLLFPRG